MDGVCNDHSRLLAGAIIALKDMNEHYYLAVEETGTNSGTFRLVGVLHYSLIGDRALFKVEMHHILFVVKNHLLVSCEGFHRITASYVLLYSNLKLEAIVNSRLLGKNYWKPYPRGRPRSCTKCPMQASVVTH